MNRHYAFKAGYWQLAGLLVVLGQFGCRATAPTVHVNKQRQEITVFSATDGNSALADPRDSSKVSDSAAVIQERLKKDPDNVGLLIDLANIYLLQGKLKEARETCRRALAHDLKNVTARKLLGKVELEGGNIVK